MPGCVKDRNGKAIGFFLPTFGTNANYEIAALELTPAGLVVTLNDKHSSFAVGMPANTTGATDSRNVKITCYLAGPAADINKQLKSGNATIGVGWGSRSARNAGAITGAILRGTGDGLYVTGQSGRTNAINLRDPNVAHPFGAVWSGAKLHGQAKLYLNANAAIYTNHPITDTKIALDSISTHGFIYGSVPRGSSAKFTIAAIRFEGPNLIPARSVARPIAIPNRKTVNHKTRLRGFNVVLPDHGILVEAAKRWGANHVRFEIYPRELAKRWKCTKSEAWDRYLRELPAYLDKAKELGLLVVIDVHTIPYFKGAEYTGKGVWKNPATLVQLKRVWRELAIVCADRDEEIWFDLLNEPLDMTQFPKEPANWRKWAQELIYDIRRINTKAWIVVETGPGSHCWGFADFPLLKDPANKVIYSAHVYQPFDFTHQAIQDGAVFRNRARGYKFKSYPGNFADAGSTVGPGRWDKHKLRREYAAVRDFQLKHNVRIWVGEFSAGAFVPGSERYVQDCIDMFEEYGWDWAFHSLHENPVWSPDSMMMHNGKVISRNEFPATVKLTERSKVILKAMAKNGRPQEPLKHRFDLGKARAKAKTRK